MLFNLIYMIIYMVYCTYYYMSYYMLPVCYINLHEPVAAHMQDPTGLMFP